MRSKLPIFLLLMILWINVHTFGLSVRTYIPGKSLLPQARAPCTIPTCTCLEGFESMSWTISGPPLSP